MRTDGDFVIYVLYTRETTSWFQPSYDHYGTPKGFSASDDCWQRTGVFGTFDKQTGIDAVSEMLGKHPGQDWKLCERKISHHHRDICEFHRTVQK